MPIQPVNIDKQISEVIYLTFELENILSRSYSPLPLWKEDLIHNKYSYLHGRMRILRSYVDIYKIPLIHYIFIRNLSRHLFEIFDTFQQLPPQRVQQCYTI